MVPMLRLRPVVIAAAALLAAGCSSAGHAATGPPPVTRVPVASATGLLTQAPSGQALDVTVCKHVEGYLKFTNTEQAATSWVYLKGLSSPLLGVAPKLRADMAELAADILAYLKGTGQASRIQSQIRSGADEVRRDCDRYGVTS
jgi:hypothetical protein